VQRREDRAEGARLRLTRLLEVVAALTGYAVGAVRQDAPASVESWVLAGVGAVAVAVPLWLKARREAQAERLAVQARSTLRLVIVDTITPIADLVGRIHQDADGDERAELRGQLQQMVVDAAAALCDGDRTRAVFFELEGDVMRPSAWAGRSDSPSAVFTRRSGDRRGQEVHLLVEHHDYLWVEDLDAERLPPGVYRRPGRGYRSFLSVAVFSGERDYGLLTVDAPEADAFSETDLEVMRALAQLLGAGQGAGLARAGTLAQYGRGGSRGPAAEGEST
jgi:GAF domain-containing protein